ncbi:hypothetical protein QE412_000894 [Microbacterium trichothecenolyticum]|uniref:Uncharacterized protein n=1 Tax=Microbacterium trichothecenolyticum TaxID=69370 RepID=A0ABU0TRM5_MICTR|nr:hypothetical protein [Microbacterium trichothecenolyticum]
MGDRQITDKNLRKRVREAQKAADAVRPSGVVEADGEASPTADAGEAAGESRPTA